MTEKPTPHPFYPMTFSDEISQTLGIHEGRLDAFTLTPKGDIAAPTIRGGLVKGGPSIRFILKMN